MYPLVEPRQRPERFTLNRFSPLAESAAFLGSGGFDSAGSVWYPDARRLLGAVPNDGTLTNMEPATAWQQTDRGNALYFDGTGVVLLSADSNTTLDFIDGSAYTLAAFVNLPGTSTTQTIMAKRSSAVTYQWEFRKLNSALSLLRTGGAVNGPVLPAGLSHVCAAVGPDGTGAFYLNGNSAGEITNVSITHRDTVASIGAWSSGTSGLSTGLIEMPCAWSRVLSPGEISALADPSNVMLEVGGVPLILPPRRVSFPAAVAEPSGFKPYWARRATHIIGGGVA